MPAPEDFSPLVADWPVDRVAVGVTDADRMLGLAGDPRRVTAVASVSKLLVGFAALVAWEEETIDLDEPAGPEGSTVRHLLAHASGLAFHDDRQLARPGTRRICSNAGIDRFSEHLAAKAGMDFADYLQQAVLDPLGMTATVLKGPPFHGIWSNVTRRRVVRPQPVGADLRDPRRQTPPLDGWAELSGHLRSFRRGGMFLWVDPEAGWATVCLTDRVLDPSPPEPRRVF